MGAYYSLKAKAVQGRLITVEVTITDPTEEHFYDNKNVALQYLWTKDHTFSVGVPPLLESIDIGKIPNKRWVVDHAGLYIDSVQIGATRNYPASDFSIADSDFFKLEHYSLPQADYHIEVTNPRWLQHLSVGHQWESAAYEMEQRL